MLFVVYVVLPCANRGVLQSVCREIVLVRACVRLLRYVSPHFAFGIQHKCCVVCGIFQDWPFWSHFSRNPNRPATSQKYYANTELTCWRYVVRFGTCDHLARNERKCFAWERRFASAIHSQGCHRGLSVIFFFLSGFSFSVLIFFVFFETPRLRSQISGC